MVTEHLQLILSGMQVAALDCQDIYDVLDALPDIEITSIDQLILKAATLRQALADFRDAKYFCIFEEKMVAGSGKKSMCQKINATEQYGLV